jgi:hypothetical protein
MAKASVSRRRVGTQRRNRRRGHVGTRRRYRRRGRE